MRQDCSFSQKKAGALQLYRGEFMIGKPLHTQKTMVALNSLSKPRYKLIQTYSQYSWTVTTNDKACRFSTLASFCQAKCKIEIVDTRRQQACRNWAECYLRGIKRLH